MENLFDCLCLFFLLSSRLTRNTGIVSVINENRKYFTQADGLKLVQLIIKCASDFSVADSGRNKGAARSGALKLLNFTLLNDPKNCRRWIQLPALGTLFAAFMKKGSKKHAKKRSASEESNDDGRSFPFRHLLTSARAYSIGDCVTSQGAR